jgi:hypothetical protein
LSATIGREVIQEVISCSTQQDFPPMFRDRGKRPSRIHRQMVGKVTGTRRNNSGLSIRRGGDLSDVAGS